MLVATLYMPTSEVFKNFSNVFTKRQQFRYDPDNVTMLVKALSHEHRLNFTQTTIQE